MAVKRYWNEAIETMAPGARRRLEAERLRQQIAYNHRSSPFFAAKLEAGGLRPADIKDIEDLARIPFMEKKEIAASQADGTLLGVNQCAPLDSIIRIQATGGTTGQPMRIGLTARDIEDYCEMSDRALWAMNCRPGDIVFTCMNFSLYAGGVSDHQTFETLGATAIPYGVGQSERLLQMMAAMKDDVCLWATPSYAVRLAEIAREMRLDPGSVGIAKGFFSGEAGMQVPGYREKIEAIWGMTARDMYGTGELGLHSGECDELAGVHYGGTGYAVIELIDPDTGAALPFADGAQGEAVYTSIHRQACPLQRMRSHDLMQVFTEPCACGRTSFRFKILGRSDDMFIVKGVNVFPLAIQATLMALRPRVTGEFQVWLDRQPPIDYPVPIKIEVARDLPADAHEALTREIAHRIQQAHNFTSAVSLVPEGTIASDKKTRRVLRLYREESVP
jgi:phenylacetate-CoA ligase